jgi:hypothetical protein
VSIPDGAVALGVSETKLRRTLLETAVPTITEYRQTRTGVRKTTVLSVETMAALRAHFERSLQPIAETEETLFVDGRAAREFSGDTDNSEPGIALEADPVPTLETVHRLGEPIQEVAQAYVPGEPQKDAYHAPNQTVPVTQFNALLYQHNVLREELSRVSEYVEGCDRLLGEMVRTIATLEERTRVIESPRLQKQKIWNPLADALNRVSAGVQNALTPRRPAAGMSPSTEVYYSSVLAGR